MRILVFLIGLLVVAAPVTRAAELEKRDLTIWTANGQSHRIEVEVAKTAAQQERGLMYRKSLAPDAGMIFMNQRDEPMVFWMKNCYIPLDMLFVTADGRISHIKANAKPLFTAEPQPEDYIPSGGPVRAVIEVIGGTAERLGIDVGDHVVFPGLGS